MAWPQHLPHFLKTDRLGSSTCSSHAAALSKNNCTHAKAGQLPRQGQPRRSGLNFPSAVRAGSHYKLTHRPAWNPANHPAVWGLLASHRCFAKPEQSAGRQVWAGGQVAAVVEAGLFWSLSYLCHFLPGDLRENLGVSQHLPSEQVCTESAEVALISLKSTWNPGWLLSI